MTRLAKMSSPATVVIAAMLAASSPAAQEQGPGGWEGAILDPSAGCDPAVMEEISRRIRTGVERETSRGERSITPPAPVGELTCLNNIFAQQLPRWRVANPANWVNHWLRTLGSRGDGLTRSLCERADDMFNDFTRPLTGGWDAALPGAGIAFPRIARPESRPTPRRTDPDTQPAPKDDENGGDPWPWLTPNPNQGSTL